MTTVEVFAPAKINLTLHITGRRDDGYHLIDSLVAFAPVSDRLLISTGHPLSLTVEGPEARGVPADMNNLAMKVISILKPDMDVSIVLEKILPVASGIGGGSADAAAVLRGLTALLHEQIAAHWETQDEILKPYAERILALGADIPMCLASKTCRARGIGEKIEFIKLPSLPAVLVNPRALVSTGNVFALLDTPENDPMPDIIPDFQNASKLVEWLANQRNDLEKPALQTAPDIGKCLAALEKSESCLIARMSGSGATCFGVYPDAERAVEASLPIRDAHPDWWVTACDLTDCSGLAFRGFS